MAEAEAPAGGAAPVPFKRSQVKVRYRNRGDAEVVFYPPARGFVNAEGVDAFDQVCLDLGIITTTPPPVEAFLYPQENQIILVPRTSQHEDWFDLRWAPGGNRAHINVIELFQELGVVVPEGSVLRVPISAENLPEFGPCVVLHMGRAETRAIGQAGSGLEGGQASTEAAAGQEP